MIGFGLSKDDPELGLTKGVLLGSLLVVVIDAVGAVIWLGAIEGDDA